MTLAAGTRLGPYLIEAPLGAGGMGEVYRATDTRLNRTVAVKVLGPHLAGRQELKARFIREAHAVAALDHPHICVLHDIGEHEGIDYLVMELVEGDTLASRLQKGPLPLDRALTCAIEIAGALDKAHRHGIIHRDLKPGNIMLTRNGVKLLDFGLAKLRAPAPSLGLSAGPTQTGRNLTGEGVILGTLQYMAPEQVEGKEADARSDIFAFGAVLYEMVTGRKAFDGSSQASVIAAILDREPPPLSALQPMTPAALDHVVKKCLAKDPEDRWQTIRDAAHQLTWIAETALPSRSGPVAPRFNVLSRMLPWGVAGVSFLIAVALTVLYFQRQPPETSTADSVQFFVAHHSQEVGGAPSPDGRLLAFAAPEAAGRTAIWLRQLGSAAARSLPATLAQGGTRGSIEQLFFWAPDSRFLGFFAEGKLKKIDIASGSIQTLADAPTPRGGTWNRDGVILFAPQANFGLVRVSAAGGQATPVTTLDRSRRETGHRFPHFLPDGRRFLYHASRRPRSESAVVLSALDSKESRRLVNTHWAAQFAHPGYLLFLRDLRLFAQPFDIDREVLEGDPVLIAESIAASTSGYADFSVSEAGVLAYRMRAPENAQLTWFGRKGEQLGTVGPPADLISTTPELSPDGTRLVATSGMLWLQDISIWDLANGTSTRITFDPQRDDSPHWSADGRSIVFRSDRGDGNYRVYQKQLAGSADEQLLFDVPGVLQLNPQDWSSDGRFVIYMAPSETTGYDLWVVPLFGDRKPFPYLRSRFHESQAQLSPDGRWLAYVSNESGTDEVYVQSFPSPGSKRQVSILWRARTTVARRQQRTILSRLGCEVDGCVNQD